MNDLVISVESSLPDAIRDLNDYKEGFTHSSDDIALDIKKLDRFLEKFSHLKKFDYSVDDDIRMILLDYSYKLYVFGRDDPFIDDNSFLTLTIYARSEEVLEKIFNDTKPFFNKVIENSVIFNEVSMDPTGKISERTSFLDKSFFEIFDPDYYPFLNVRELFRSFFKSKENILYLCGDPGTGKSKLALGFLGFLREIQDILGKSCYVKDENLLSDPSFWAHCKEQKYDTIIIDDLDTELTARTSTSLNTKDVQKNTFISQILSFTDGLLESKTKIIITTNRSFKNLDSALTRKGRMFDILEMRPLKKDESRIIFEKFLDGFEDFWGTRSSITQAELGSEIKRITIERNENIHLKEYLKEVGISKIDFTSKKEIGF